MEARWLHHTLKKVAANLKAETEERLAANMKAKRQQADGATAKAATAAVTSEIDTIAAARQKSEYTEYIAELTAQLTEDAETMENGEAGLISDQRSISTSRVDVECASESDESDSDFITVNRDRKGKRASTSSNGSAVTAQVREDKVQRAKAAMGTHASYCLRKRSRLQSSQVTRAC